MSQHLNSTHKSPTHTPSTTKNSKTPILSTNKPLQNVNKKQTRQKKHTKQQKTHKKHSKTLSYPHHNLPPYPTYNPLWQPVAIIHNRYAMGPKIDSGSFGSVHSGVDLKDNYRYVAIKLEPIAPKHHPQLEKEYKIYAHIRQHMNNNNITIGIPNIYYFGPMEGEPFNALIMEMLGPSLEKLFEKCGRKFSVKTVLMIADQMLSRLEFIHDTGYLHRDLKPDNFLMGMYNSERVVYAVDLGLGKSYIDHNSHHVAYTEGKTLTGTARYASVNTHLGVAQSRRDDLESLAYIFMYFLRGRLPWQGIKAKSRHEKYEKIAQKKLSTLPEQLCKGFPEEFAHLIRYSWRLGYEERPNYERLRRMFREVFFKMDFAADWEYDWDIKGWSATKLALENHPFIRGNMDRKSKRHKNRDRDRDRNREDCKSGDRYFAHWGGDKHREHRRGKHKARHSLPNVGDKKNNIINAHIERVEKAKYTSCLPTNTQHSPAPNIIYNNNNTRATAAKLKREKHERRFWDFSCFNSPPRSKKMVNTEKFIPDRRQSMNIVSNTKNKRHNTSNNVHKRQQLPPQILAKKRLSQPITLSTQQRFIRSPIKHQYYQQSPAYSPAHIRHGNNNNIASPHTYTTYNTYATYTPSYSHQSSSPSPINMHSGRRYSDNYANKPIITAPPPQQQQHGMPQQSMGGYIINAPTHNVVNAPLRLQRSQSQRLQGGRRSVVLDRRSNTPNSKKNKTSAQLHDEWKQKYANDRLYTQDAYPYTQQAQAQIQPQPQPQQQAQTHVATYNEQYNSPYFFPPTPHPTHIQVQQQAQYVSYGNNNNNNNNNNFPDLSYSIVRNEASNSNSKSYVIHDLDNLNNNNNNNNDHLSIPIQKERKNTCTLPLKQGLKKAVKNNSPSPIKSNNSPRSKGSNKSNKSAKSHRSSRNHSASNQKSKKLSPKSNKSNKSSSNSPILDESRQRIKLKSPTMNNQNKFVRASSQKSYHSTSSSMLVNASRWNGEQQQQHFIKSRMSVIADNTNSNDDHEDMEQIQDDIDGFKRLETQFTGRSLTNNTLNTVTKDEKERKNSASTSKGLLTEDQRDFSSHTETLNQKRQTTPRSYTRHPFVKNSSNSSTQQTVSSELFITNKQKHNINTSNIPIMEEDLNLD